MSKNVTGVLANYIKAMFIQCQEKALFSQKKLYISTAYIEIIGFSKKPIVEIIPVSTLSETSLFQHS